LCQSPSHELGIEVVVALFCAALLILQTQGR